MALLVVVEAVVLEVVLAVCACGVGGVWPGQAEGWDGGDWVEREKMPMTVDEEKGGQMED